MLTAKEIQKKEFTHGVRGYKEEEVEAFLDEILATIETLHADNDSLRDNIGVLTMELERYRNSEGAIFTTLESAKALMTDISSSAEKRAEIVLKNAELDADRIRREAEESVERLTEEALALSRRWELFKARFHNLLETELDRFESFAADLLLEEPHAPGDVKLIDRTVRSSVAGKSKEKPNTDLTGTIRTSRGDL
ncbi:MAG: DivIVA domain-containing protein [Clostridiales Family XIII bacterium]|jgi:cell division initiation protein|nr:DivIVA domain-containing protein [Clostridiales Family XIII bacterium]